MFDTFLRVLLSVALAVSFTPISRSVSYAAEAGGESVVAATATDGESGEGAAAACEGSAGDVSVDGDADAGNAVPDVAGADAELVSPSALVGAESASATLPTLGATEVFDQAKQVSGLPLTQAVYPYVKLLSNGRTYECDSSGTLLQPLDDNDPALTSVDARFAVTLIVDYHAGDIPMQLCEGSVTLKTVRFENDRVNAIGEKAFFQCVNLSEISFSDMVIGYIEDSAFYGCTSLTSLNIKKTATIMGLGERCFAYSGLISTGLDNVKGLSAIPDEAFRGCENLTNTGLETNALNSKIETIGALAFANCPSLRTSGLERNSTVRELGQSCFASSNMEGGLLLPEDSKIEMLPNGAFRGTNLDFVYFQCDHAVLISSETFPRRGMNVLVPSGLLSLYESGQVARNWESCNGIGPVDAAKAVTVFEAVSDPDTLTYAPGDVISLAGMRIKFDYGTGVRTYDCADLTENYVFSRFIDAYPLNGWTFEPRFDGLLATVTYDDDVVCREAYSSQPLRQVGSTKLSVNVKCEGAQVGESASGSGAFERGETCTVTANSSVRGRTFAYWKDEAGTIVSEHWRYDFTVERDIVLTAVFTDEVTVKPEIRLNTASGQPVDARAWVVVDGVDYPDGFTTYEGKKVTLKCAYDASKLRFDHWESEKGGFWLGGNSPTEPVIEYEAVAGDQPLAVLVEHGQLNVSARSAAGLALGSVSGSGSYDVGDFATLTAIPAAGCVFVGWTHRGEVISTEPSYSYKVLDFDEVIGWFAVDRTQTWVAVRADSAQPEMGSVEGAGVYAQGAEVTLVATPAAGCEFAGWLRDGESIEGGATLTIAAEGAPAAGLPDTLKLSPKYTATFARSVCNVGYTQVIDLGGRTLMDSVDVPSVSGSFDVHAGQQVQLDAAALGMLDEDIAFAGWYDKATGKQLCADVEYTFAPMADVQLEARFALKDVAVRINPAQTTDSSDAYAHLSVEAANCYRNAGETVSLAATPDNAQFLGWYADDGSSEGAYVVSDKLTCEYVVENPAGSGVASQAEITPRYCACQASVVLGVADVDEDGNPAGEFLFSGLYGIGSQVTVNAVPEPGYVFDYATDAHGNVVATAECGGSYTFRLTEDTQLVAHFRWTDDEDEAFEALKTALIATVLTVAVIATAYGFGELVDPIAAETLVEIEAAQNSEELAAVGKKFVGKIKDLFDVDPDNPDKPDKPKGDHRVEVVATAVPEAGGIVTGGGVHYEGTEAVLSAVPNLGYHFVCWKLDGIEYGITPKVTVPITKVTPEVTTMTAVFEKDIRVTTSVEVEGVAADVATACNATPDVQTLKRGEEAKVIATDNADYAFVGWFENGVEVSRTPVYVFPAEVDRHLVAKFRKADKTITVSVEPAGAAEVLCNGVPVEGGVVRATDGDILTLTVHPNVRPDDAEKSYKLVEWRKTDAQGRTVVSRQDAYEFLVDGNAHVTAVMDGKDAHTVRAKTDPVDGGKVLLRHGEATGEVLEIPEGESVTAEATAADGYLFDGWYVTYGAEDVTPTYVSSEQKHTFTPAADCTVTACFAKACKVSVVVEPTDSLAGKYKVTGDGYTESGQSVVLSVSLAEDMRDEFTFKGWFREGSDIPMGTDPTHLELVPEDDMTVRAVYIPHRYTVKVQAKQYDFPRGTVEIEGYPAGTTGALVGYGSTVTLRAKPEEGFRLKKWKGSNGDKFKEEEIKVRVTGNVTYTASFTGATPEVTIAADTWLGGTVTCNGLEITPTTDDFKLGQELHLTAKPRDGWLFWGWYVNGKFKSLSESYTVTAKGKFAKSKRCSIVAAFKPVDILCVPVANPSEGGSVRASRIITERNTDVALKAQAAPGYVFTGWYSPLGILESEEPEFTCHEMMTHVHEARFEPCSYTVETAPVVQDESGALVESDEAGWVEGAGEVGAGYSATLEAHAQPGYAFERWVDTAGTTLGEDASLRFAPAEDTAVRAVFAKKQFTVNVSAVEGYGSSSGGGTYAAGDIATVRAIPDAGATFVGWFKAGACVSADATYRFAVHEDMDLQALFGAGAYTVRTIASPVEAGYVNGFGGFADGQRTTLSAVAKTGFTFDCWRDAQGNVVSTLPDCTVAVTGDAAYTACFARNVYSVELTSNIEGVGVLSGEGLYDFGQTVELIAEQTDDKRFAGWQRVDEDGQVTSFKGDAHCWFTFDENLVSGMDGNVLELQALFADPYEIAVNADVTVQGKLGDRRCRVQGTGVYQVGDNVTLNAVAGLGYKFVGWSTDEKGENIVETNAVFDFTAKTDVMYYAQFAVDGQVSVDVTQSSIFRGFTMQLGSGMYDKGDPFVVMAVPWPGYRFSHWINGAGSIISYNAVYVGVAQQDMQLTAVFYDSGADVQAATYPHEAGFSMVVPGTGVGYINPSWLVTIAYPGWKFRYWIDENGCPVGFSPLIVRPTFANKTYTAYYVRGAWNILAVDLREGGHIEGSEGVDVFGWAVADTVEDGTSFTLHAVPDDGYTFDGWYAFGEGASDDAEPLSTDADWTFTVTDDVKVVARFKELPKYEVTATAQHGTVTPASRTVVAGDNAAFAAQPDAGCYLVRASVSDVAGDGTTGKPVDLDISDYKGGSYAVKLENVNASAALTFAFAAAGAPQIYAQPHARALYEGRPLTLSVAADAAQDVLDHEAIASGAVASHTLSYQWFYAADEQSEGQALAGETSAELKRSSVSSSDAGWYYCRVTQTYLGTETVTDSNRAHVAVVTPGEFVFNSTDLPDATVHTDYSATVGPAEGGERPYSYRLADESTLPDGLQLERDVADGRNIMRIDGTPNTAGVFAFEIECTDNAGNKCTAQFVLRLKSQVVDLSFEQANLVYNGSPQRPALLGVPSELADTVTFAYIGTGATRYSSTDAPTDAGTYRVVATLKADGYVGRAACTFEIAKKPVAFTVDAPDAVYDGQVHAAAVDAQGAGAADYTVVYRGVGDTAYGPTSEAPRDSGTYAVTAAVTNSNMSGAETDIFTISKAPQVITGATEYSGVYGGSDIVLENVAKTPVTFELVEGEGDAPAPIALNGRCASVRAAGTAYVKASAPASRNYCAAEDVTICVTVSPAQLLVYVHDAKRMEGEDNPAFASSLVSRADTSGLAVAYVCEADASSPAGEYAIGASVSDPNFAATVVPGTLTVTPKPAPDPDNPQPGPDPDNPDPDNPDNPKPGPDPDNPEPGPSPDPDKPDPGPSPDPDNPDPIDPPNPGPGPDNPDNPDPDNPQPGPGPDNPDPDNPNNPDKPDPGNPDNPDKPDPSKPDPSKPDPGNPDKPDPSDPSNPPGPTDPDKPAPLDPNKPENSTDINDPEASKDASSSNGSPNNSANRSGVISSPGVLGQTGDAAAQAGIAAVLAAALAALLGALASRKRRN